MIIDMLIYVFEYTDGSSKMVAFETKQEVIHYAHMEGDHLVTYYMWVESDAALR